MSEPVLPLSVIDISVRISVDAVAVLQVILVVALVLSAGQLGKAVLLFIGMD